MLFGGPRGCMPGPMPAAPGPFASPFDKGGRKPAAQHCKSSCISLSNNTEQQHASTSSTVWSQGLLMRASEGSGGPGQLLSNVATCSGPSPGC